MNRKKKNNKLDVSAAGTLGHNPFAGLGQQFGISESPSPTPAKAPAEEPDTKQPMLMVRMEKRKKSKMVTCIYHVASGQKELLKKLKQKLGTGGALDGETLELQGDFRTTLPDVLQSMGFKVRLGN